MAPAPPAAAYAPLCAALPSPPPPHSAFLDDVNLRQAPGFPAASAAQFNVLRDRCAAGGLLTREDKSLVVAPLGAFFTPAEQERITGLAIPWVDAATPALQRGFRVVGVPVGAPAFVAAAMRRALFYDPLWRLAWQVIGMARTQFMEAFRLFRFSLTRRMGFLARNVDPVLGEVWYAAFDAFCTWAFEGMLALNGVASVAHLRARLEQACDAGDVAAAAAGDLLCLPALAPHGVLLPAPLAALPLEVARLPAREGGLSLPTLQHTSPAAFMGRCAHTLPLTAAALLPDYTRLLATPAQPATVVAGTADSEAQPLPPALASLRVALQGWLAAYRRAEEVALAEVAAAAARVSSPLAAALPPPAPPPADPPEDPPPLDVPAGLACLVPLRMLEWADAPLPPTVLATLACFAAAAPPTPPVPLESGVGALPQSQPGGGGADALADEGLAHEVTAVPKRVRAQRGLSAFLQEARSARLYAALATCGWSGRYVAAQLRSQGSAGALAWLEHLPFGAAPLDAVQAVTMTLLTICVDAWRVPGERCPFGNCTAAPTAAHAAMCVKQNAYGSHAQHSALKFKTQDICRSAGVRHVYSEATHPFPDGHGRMDTVLPQCSLLNAPHKKWAEGRGALVDTTVTAPTCVALVTRAAKVGGFAAGVREVEKDDVYLSQFDGRSWVFVPLVHETFGRLGRRAREFLGHLAGHAAVRGGGSFVTIRRRRGELTRRYVAELSFTLARSTADRILAYARTCGLRVAPVSSTLVLSA
jgi:hypothetical protein